MGNVMSIPEAMGRREELECSINATLANFERETGLAVSDIEVRRLPYQQGVPGVVRQEPDVRVVIVL